MFKLPIDKATYKHLNRVGSINSKFSSRSVGKCMKLIDDCFRTCKQFNKETWANYYYEVKGTKRLTEITDYIADFTKIDRDIIKRYVFYRVIGQTYNGFITELKVIGQMQKHFYNLDFTKTEYYLDEQYFTDFEAYYQSELMFGGQIKPISYKYMSTPYQKQAKKNHEEQKQEYIRLFRVPHILVYYEDGKLYEQDLIFNKINLILSRNII